MTVNLKYSARNLEWKIQGGSMEVRHCSAATATSTALTTSSLHGAALHSLVMNYKAMQQIFAARKRFDNLTNPSDPVNQATG